MRSWLVFSWMRTCEIDQIDQKLTARGQAKDNTLTWRCVGKESFEASFKATVDSTGRQMSGEWATHAAARGTFKGSPLRSSPHSTPPRWLR